MSDEIDMSNGRSNMAYVGDKPWHDLGHPLKKGATIEEWKETAGFNWDVLKTPVCGTADDGAEIKVPNRQIMYRSDTKAPLSVMSSNFRITQPSEVLEFFRDLADTAGFQLDTAGMLRGGATYWALARMDDSFDVGGGDDMLPYLLLATSCDGTMSNTAMFTAVRVVCWNTIQMALGSANESTIRIPHSTTFNPDRVKAEMGLATGQWDTFKKSAVDLSKRKVSQEETIKFFLDTMYPGIEFDPADPAAIVKRKTIAQLCGIFEGGVGQGTATTEGTAWGLLNAVTRWTDHECNSADNDNRMQSAWFGAKARVKTRAMTNALTLLV